MIIDIKETSIDLSPVFLKWVKEKLFLLGKFVKKYEEKGELHLFLELSKTTKHHRKGEVFAAELMMELPKKMVRAIQVHQDMRIAVEEVKKMFQQELVRYKEKHLAKEFGNMRT